MDENFRQIVINKMNSLDGGFGETASSLTFQDPDEDDEVGVDTQADDFRFDFTLPSQNFGAGGAGNFGGLASQSQNQFGDKVCIFESIYNNFSTGRNGFFERKFLNFEILLIKGMKKR